METIFRVTNYLWTKITNWMKEEKNQERFIVTCFIISLIPLLVLSFYNHPVMDDFNYGVLTKRALEENEGLAKIPAVIKAAIERAVYLWNVWQGTFSFSVIGALRPSIISEKLTFTSTFILLGLFVWGFIYTGKVVLHRIMGLSKSVAVMVSCVLMTLCIQYVPYGQEAFYWWIGSIGYTGLFAVMMMLYAKLFWCNTQGRITWKQMILFIFLMVLLAGGMFPIGLLTAVVMVLLLLDVLIHKKYSKAIKIQYIVLNVIYFAGFFFNLLAPGNARRQSYFNPRTPFEAVYKSYTKCLAYMLENTNVIIILVMIGLFVYMFYQLKKTKFTFRAPLMFTLVTFSMVVVMWVPGIYAVRYISGGRYYNILHYAMILFYGANAIYYAGWLRRQYEKCSGQVQSLAKGAAPVLLGMLAIGCTVLGFLKIDIVTDLEEITTATALKSLVYGEAKVYHEEMKAREELYNDPDITHVEVEPLTYQPELLYFGTLTTDPNDSRNQAMCNFYGKEYMVLLGDEEVVEEVTEEAVDEEVVEEETADGEASEEKEPEENETTGESEGE